MNSQRDNPFTSRPQRFEFYYGRYSGNSVYCSLDSRGALSIEHTQGGNFSGTAKTISPDVKQWSYFRRSLDIHQIWNWESEYSAAHDCCGVTYWHLIVDWDECHLSSRGANAYPGGKGSIPPREFIQFLDALAGLTGESVQ